MVTPTLPGVLHARQIVSQPQPSSPLTGCPTVTLPVGGIIIFNKTTTIHLDSAVTYRPECFSNDAFIDPFYASTTVFIYVIATTTVLAWMLLILLLTNQRSHDAGRAPKSTGWLQGRGVPGAIAVRTPIGGLGNRPWLQKAAVFLVTLGFTVASVDTFRIAQLQHERVLINARWAGPFAVGTKVAQIEHAPGITNARLMRDYVVNSTEIRVLRVVSGVFVWLAQIQTLIRLFPRRKEKLIIKWFGFSLILCDLVFSCLNMFWIKSSSLPGSYQDAISALSYLFQLGISLLYAAWVLYYVATKRRYAFFWASELNMSIIAALALISIAIPVAFFIADISVPPVGGWGDLFRWTGAAAASVVVWEWVERIEALEREEKKDGILGREVFDEDELPTYKDSSRSATRRNTIDSGSSGKEKSSAKGFGNISRRYVRSAAIRKQLGISSASQIPNRNLAGEQILGTKVESENLGTRLAVSSSPSSRPHSPPSTSDTGSAGSTVYAVHYHSIEHTTAAPDIHSPVRAMSNRGSHGPPGTNAGNEEHEITDGRAQKRQNETLSQPARAKLAAKTSSSWAFATNAFKRRKRSPPLEIKNAMRQSEDTANQPSSQPNRFGWKGHLTAFGVGKGDHLAHAMAGSDDVPIQQHPTVIPAPPRGQTWSPDILRHSPNNLLQNTAHVNPALAYRRVSIGASQTGITHQNMQPLQDRPPAAESGTMVTFADTHERRYFRPTDEGGANNSGQLDGTPAQIEIAHHQLERGATPAQIEHGSEVSIDPKSAAVEHPSQSNDIRPNTG